MNIEENTIKDLIKELQVLTYGIKEDFAYRRKTRFQAMEHKKLTATTVPQFMEFSEPLSDVSIAITDMGTAAHVYVAIEGTAGTDSIELNANIRVWSFGGIWIKKISVMTDAGTSTTIQAFGLRGG